MLTRSRAWRWLTALLAGATLLSANGCLPHNYWASLVQTAGDTAVATFIAALVESLTNTQVL